MTKVLRATWQRCRVHFGRTTLAHAGKTQRRIVSAWIGTGYAQEDAAAAHTQWRTVADQLRPKVPKLAALMDAAEEDVLAYMHFPAAHRAKLHSTNPIERLNGEIKRRTDVVGIFPNEAAAARSTMLPIRARRLGSLQPRSPTATGSGRRRARDTEHHLDLVAVNFDTTHDGPDDLAATVPVQIAEPGVDPLCKLLQAANHQVQAALGFTHGGDCLALGI